MDRNDQHLSTFPYLNNVGLCFLAVKCACAPLNRHSGMQPLTVDLDKIADLCVCLAPGIACEWPHCHRDDVSYIHQ